MVEFAIDSRRSQRSAERRLAVAFRRSMRSPRLRSRCEFAESEIVLPRTGPKANRRLKFAYQPYFGTFLRAMDNGPWRRFAFTGSVQSGKTTLLMTNVMWHLFERREDVVLQLPKKKMGHKKWRDDLRPLIEASRYHALLPKTGKGSQGGDFEEVRFRNGTVLTLFSGSGSDEERSSITAPVFAATEVDKMDTPAEVSEESDPISQGIARTKAFGERAFIYLECTVSHDQGRIWQEFQAGTASELLLPCPHCGQFVRLEREEFIGWQEAASALDARDRAAFGCPACGGLWSDAQRIAANRRMILLHAGQKVHTGEDGAPVVTGEPRRTLTFSFRWNEAHNLFHSQGFIGMEEWQAARGKSNDPDAAEKERKQFAWTIPVEPDLIDLSEIDHDGLMARMLPDVKRGTFPWEADLCTVGIDVAERWSHCAVWGFQGPRIGHLVDFEELNYIEERKQHGFATALYSALWGWHRRQFGETGGFLTPDGERRFADCVLIDSGYFESQAAIYRFCKEANSALNRAVYWPFKGFGAGQGQRTSWYSAPRQRNSRVRFLGEQYHGTWQREHRLTLIHGDANYWKSQLFDGFKVEQGEPGALTICAGDLRTHKHLLHHLTAEHEIEKPDKNGMPRRVWVRRAGRRSNHFLDAAYMGLLAGHFVGARIIEEPAEPQTKPIERPEFTTPDGRPFFILARDQ